MTTKTTKSKSVKDLEVSLGKAGARADKRDRAVKKVEVEKEAPKQDSIEEKKKTLLQKLKDLTGEDYYLGVSKDPFSGEPFIQAMQRNIAFLSKINYLTQAEESFLWRVQAYVEFKSNVIICEEEKFPKKSRKKKDVRAAEGEEFHLAKAATITDISNMIGKSRRQTTEIMNSLKEKELLHNPEMKGQVTENGRTVTPRTWIVNPYVLCCAPRKNKVDLDILTMRMFQNTLKNLKDQNGKR